MNGLKMQGSLYLHEIKKLIYLDYSKYYRINKVLSYQELEPPAYYVAISGAYYHVMYRSPVELGV